MPQALNIFLAKVNFLAKAKAYIIITKPRLVVLLYFTGLASILIASSIYGFYWQKITLISISIILSVMGSNATTAYIDREMDSVMSRTVKRPVPTGIIKPAVNALIFGTALVVIGIVLAGLVNLFAAIFIFLGFLDSAVIYNALTKKKLSINILLGAPAGGMPIFAGWTAISGGKIDLISVLMFFLVMLWTPMHIWSLAYFYKNDYKKANVPMLPVIIKDKIFFILLTVLNFLLIFFSVFIAFYFKLSLIYIIFSVVFGAVIIALSFILIITNKAIYAWILFKFSSPYLGAVFLILIIEYLVLK